MLSSGEYSFIPMTPEHRERLFATSGGAFIERAAAIAQRLDPERVDRLESWRVSAVAGVMTEAARAAEDEEEFLFALHMLAGSVASSTLAVVTLIEGKREAADLLDELFGPGSCLGEGEGR